MKDYLCSVRNFVLLCLAFFFSSVSVDTDSPVDLICLANGSHICFSQSSSFTCGCYKDIEAHLVFWRFSNWPQFWESKIVRIINVYSAFSTRKDQFIGTQDIFYHNGDHPQLTHHYNLLRRYIVDRHCSIHYHHCIHVHQGRSWRKASGDIFLRTHPRNDHSPQWTLRPKRHIFAIVNFVVIILCLFS